MGVIVYPSLAQKPRTRLACGNAEVAAILSQKYQWFVEEEVVDCSLLTVGTIVGIRTGVALRFSDRTASAV